MKDAYYRPTMFCDYIYIASRIAYFFRSNADMPLTTDSATDYDSTALREVDEEYNTITYSLCCRSLKDYG